MKQTNWQIKVNLNLYKNKMLTILNDNPGFPKRNYILDDLCVLEKSINRVNLGEVNSEDKPEYTVDNIQAVIPRTKVQTSNDILIEKAIMVLDSRLKNHDLTIGNPQDTVKYLKLRLQEEEREIFACMFLSNRHQLIAYEELFKGTIDGAAVYPREVVKRALELNAAALIISHNHPSGIPEPSQADETITHRLAKALGTVDIRLLDHIIIGDSEHTSLAERGVI